MYQDKLQKKGVKDIGNRNRIQFELYDDLIGQVYSQFNKTIIGNQYSHS